MVTVEAFHDIAAQARGRVVRERFGAGDTLTGLYLTAYHPASGYQLIREPDGKIRFMGDGAHYTSDQLNLGTLVRCWGLGRKGLHA